MRRLWTRCAADTPFLSKQQPCPGSSNRGPHRPAFPQCGETALHRAAAAGRVDCARLLVTHGRIPVDAKTVVRPPSHALFRDRTRVCIQPAADAHQGRACHAAARACTSRCGGAEVPRCGPHVPLPPPPPPHPRDMSRPPSRVPLSHRTLTRSQKGETALYLAAAEGHEHMCRELLDRGACAWECLTW